MARLIIDCHNHPNWHRHDVDALVRNMDEHGIAKTWLLAWEISPKEYEQACPGYFRAMDPRGIAAPLDLVIEGLHRHPDRFIGGWAPDPRDRYARARFQAAVEIHRIRVYGELKCRIRFDDPDAIAMYRLCGKLGVPVLFHLQCAPADVERQAADINTWVEWYGGDMRVIETICQMCPETAFIGHGPGFWREMSGDCDQVEGSYPKGPVTPGGRLIEVLRRCPNLHCDISAGSGANGVGRDLENGRRFCLEFQDRILFGRDYFDRQQMDVLDSLHLDEEVLEKIYHRNAERLVRD
ncbi:MAG: amidohydrolase family protein [Lentisphaerae bacterium]|nr:amidohydrolase family protein [Lentisphaerota bacterium]